MPTDFRDGKTFPRRGRDEADGFMWLWRVFDKARASADGTIFDYIYPCPMDQGVLERWGLTPEQFDEAVRAHRTDEAILAWLKQHVSAEQGATANRWLVETRSENLDRQDREEGAVAA
jgi:hypothetical protein